MNLSPVRCFKCLLGCLLCILGVLLGILALLRGGIGTVHSLLAIFPRFRGLGLLIYCLIKLLPHGDWQMPKLLRQLTECVHLLQRELFVFFFILFLIQIVFFFVKRFFCFVFYFIYFSMCFYLFCCVVFVLFCFSSCFSLFFFSVHSNAAACPVVNYL
ncbi:unnamed protein product [Trypanosoma congolense IL3000]|uniref:WGS project CAEQ00000000 data, annotated contig 950 n=1 Tax=Trypanosoma congolense (strain IL3000) TaxID=1068625 RepID=F9WJU1_TRYCI|nr:unnamed protein product [Trypanosoma congolense IL3000]